MEGQLKSAIQFLAHRCGYEIHRYRPDSSGIHYTEDLTFSVGSIFRYFRDWVTNFEIEGQTSGGHADYSTVRSSVLNVPELLRLIAFRGKTIMELGPLEGGNTILLQKLGAKRIVAVEGRVENYVKCCVIKNLFRLDAATFYLDDVRNVSRAKYGEFDVILLAGVLYHLNDPHVLLERLRQMSECVLVSTHYADEDSPHPNAETSTLDTQYGRYRGRIFREGPLADPNSGLQRESFWPYESDLIRMCQDVGYANVRVILKNPEKSERRKLIYVLLTRA